MRCGLPYSLDVYDKNAMMTYGKQLTIFEKKLQHRYPLGNDSFIIDHGDDYTRFFKRLGHVQLQIYKDDQNIVATVCYILREIHFQKVWYICDLKIENKYRGNRLTYGFFVKCVIMEYFTCNKCYAISMNDNTENRVARLAQNIGGSLFKFELGPLIYIYQIQSVQMKQIAQIVGKICGPISYVSLTGIKDLILTSTNKPMSILHVNYDKFGRTKEGQYYDKIIDNFEYMFCCTANSSMKIYLDKIQCFTSVTASIMYYNMDNFDWNFIQTHEI